MFRPLMWESEIMQILIQNKETKPSKIALRKQKTQVFKEESVCKMICQLLLTFNFNILPLPQKITKKYAHVLKSKYQRSDTEV